MVECKQNGVPLLFKFSMSDQRHDQIVIYTPYEQEKWFEKGIKIVESITKDMDLGPLPQLIGNYKNGIGIVTDVNGRSFTQDIVDYMQKSVMVNMIENYKAVSAYIKDEEVKNRFYKKGESYYNCEFAVLRRSYEEDGHMRAKDETLHELSEQKKEIYDAFHEFLKNNPQVLKTMINDFRDISSTIGGGIHGNRDKKSIIFSEEMAKRIAAYRENKAIFNGDER